MKITWKANRIIIPVLILLVLILFAINIDKKKASIKIESAKIAGNEVEVTATIKNTGKEQHNFPINLALRKVDGKWVDLPPQFQFLEPDKEMSIKFNQDLKKIGQIESVRVAVWEKVDKHGRLKKQYAKDEKKI